MITTIDKQEISVNINNTVEEIDRAIWILSLIRKEHAQKSRPDRFPSERPIERFFNESNRRKRSRDHPFQMNLSDRF